MARRPFQAIALEKRARALGCKQKNAPGLSERYSWINKKAHIDKAGKYDRQKHKRQ
jgi:hypothetical protein